MPPTAIHYVPPPTEFAVLVVHRDARTWSTPQADRTWSTPQADHLLQSNSERRRYPDHGRPPLMWIPAVVRTAIHDRAWSVSHVE